MLNLLLCVGSTIAPSLHGGGTCTDPESLRGGKAGATERMATLPRPVAGKRACEDENIINDARITCETRRHATVNIDTGFTDGNEQSHSRTPISR